MEGGRSSGESAIVAIERERPEEGQEGEEEAPVI
jgi:hypothetical protein